MEKTKKGPAILFALLAAVLASRLIYAFAWHEIWWDSGVYIGMGKYALSGGKAGLWEHIRPPLWPLVLGLLWKAGLPVVLLGRLLEIALFTGIVWLTYALCLKWFERRTATITATIIAFSPIFYYLSFHHYTEIPAVFLVLLSVYLFEKKLLFWAGIAAGLAFLTKFPAGIFIAALGITLLARKEFRATLPLGAGFVLPLIPFFTANLVAYGNPLEPLQAAQDAISRALGCNVLRFKPWWFYFKVLYESETKLHIASILGLFALLKSPWKNLRKKIIILFSLGLPMAYFFQLHCRDYRYLTLALPFITCLTGAGIIFLADLLFKKFKLGKQSQTILYYAILAFILFWTASVAHNFYSANEPKSPDPVLESYLTFLQNKTVRGEVWVSNPIIAAYTDLRLEKVYYPIFGADVATDFLKYVSEHKNKIAYVLLDKCGGGLICHPEDPSCEEQTKKLLSALNESFTKVFDKESKGCWYKIYASIAQANASIAEYPQS